MYSLVCWHLLREIPRKLEKIVVLGGAPWRPGISPHNIIYFSDFLLSTMYVVGIARTMLSTYPDLLTHYN